MTTTLLSVKEAIDLHLEGLLEDGSELPLPRSIAEHQKNPDFSAGIWAAIDIDVTRFDDRRVSHQIGQYAKACGSARSGFFVDCARRAMASQNEPRSRWEAASFRRAAPINAPHKN